MRSINSSKADNAPLLAAPGRTGNASSNRTVQLVALTALCVGGLVLWSPSLSDVSTAWPVSRQQLMDLASRIVSPAPSRAAPTGDDLVRHCNVSVSDGSNVSAADLPAAYAKRHADILCLCGDLCRYDKGALANLTVADVAYFKAHPNRKAVSCPILYSRTAETVFDAAPIEWPPAKMPPAAMRDDYLLGGMVSVHEYYWAQRYGGASVDEEDGPFRVAKWSKATVDDLKNRALSDVFNFGNHGSDATRYLFYLFRNNSHLLKDMHVLVVGSENPWVEALVLAAGASHVSTLEYGAINCTHPNVTTYTPSVFNAMYRDGTLPTFDAAVSFSSIEHSGLGRYGDSLNPWGDVIQIARLTCVVKEGGAIITGLPSSARTNTVAAPPSASAAGAPPPLSQEVVTVHEDVVAYNAHRVYGAKRLWLMSPNLDVIGLAERNLLHVVYTALNVRTSTSP